MSDAIAAWVNSLPEPYRKYVHDLEMIAAHAGSIRERLLREDIERLTKERDDYATGKREGWARVNVLESELAAALTLSPMQSRLANFYSVSTKDDLISMQAHHVEKLQAKLPPLRDDQPRSVREG